MFRQALFAAALAAGASSAGAQTVQPDPQRCAALTAESEKLKGQVGEARTRKAAGFLAGMAGRAMAYAPGVELGDSRLARFAGQEVETAVHTQASSGLDKVQSDGKGADVSAGKARLKALEAEAGKLGCPKA